MGLFLFRKINAAERFRHGIEHHAYNRFSRCDPMLVGTGGLVLFPGTLLLEDVEQGKFTPLSEKEMLIELRAFAEHLTCDCSFITHHTISGKNLSGPDFLQRKEKILAALDDEINFGNMDVLESVRRSKRIL